MSKVQVKYDILSVFILILWLSSILGLAFCVGQKDFNWIVTLYIVAFAGYMYFIFRSDQGLSFTTLIIAAFVARAAAGIAFPGLSDDIYRFVWDGRLYLEGISAFEQLPLFYLLEGNQIKGLDQFLFDQLNSQEYFSIYPTVGQWIFAFSAWIFPESIYGFSVVMKSILSLMDMGSILILIFLLKEIIGSKKRVLLYALNPLIIIELSGNGHLEAAMIFFLLLSIVLLWKNRIWWSAMAMAAAIASKLLPLMFLPFLLVLLPWRKVMRYYLFVGMGLVFFAIPFYDLTLLENLGDSLSLYFQRFEFNASVYYVIRWVGFQYKGYNIIQSAGPMLGIMVFLSIWILTWWNRNGYLRNFPTLCLWGMTIYLSLSSLVHPWYITPMIALCLFSDYRFPILWSFVIIGSYFNYTYEPFSENLWIVALEYVLVFGVMIFEIKKFNFTRPALKQKGLGEGC
ncbi:MAG: DUF2029 domain-containing protein [Bacteroidia bacterium]|nr:DUF2029 domain-containing protein [Bacteroidia bacterium]